MKIVEDERELNIINEDIEDQNEIIKDLEDNARANPNDPFANNEMAYGVADITLESEATLYDP